MDSLADQIAVLRGVSEGVDGMPCQCMFDWLAEASRWLPDGVPAPVLLPDDECYVQMVWLVNGMCLRATVEVEVKYLSWFGTRQFSDVPIVGWLDAHDEAGWQELGRLYHKAMAAPYDNRLRRCNRIGLETPI